MSKNYVKSFLIGLFVASFLIFAGGISAGDLFVDPGDSIQAAITVATSGDTIYVAAGTYTETFVVDKQLTIQGAGSASTIIDAIGGIADYGILLTAGGTSASQRLTIKGFTIKNSPSHGIKAYKGDGLNLDYVTFEDLILTLNGSRGMEIHNSVIVNDMKITSCEFVNNGAQGLRTASNVIVNGMTITDSKFNENTYGMYLQGTLDGVSIKSTTMNDNSPGYGLYAAEYGAITNFLIECSEVVGNNLYGIVFWSGSAAGIDGITIRRTTIENSGRGFWIGADVISNFLMEESSVINNVRTSTDTIYEGMTFSYGILTNAVVKHSNIYGNNGRGIANYCTGIVDARANWWGDASGPLDELNIDGLNQWNPSGLGDAVTEYVLYDPWIGREGFVTGGGTIWSEAGDYVRNPVAEGVANFGFVVKKKKGAEVPAGNTNFVFSAGDLHFQSSEYDWLQVAGNKAMFKGVGTIDSTSDIYKFMIWADDDPDTFRIKIWEEENGSEDIVYDNGSQQVITGGNIFIHKEKKK